MPIKSFFQVLIQLSEISISGQNFSNIFNFQLFFLIPTFIWFQNFPTLFFHKFRECFFLFETIFDLCIITKHHKYLFQNIIYDFPTTRPTLFSIALFFCGIFGVFWCGRFLVLFPIIDNYLLIFVWNSDSESGLPCGSKKYGCGRFWSRILISGHIFVCWSKFHFMTKNLISSAGN